MIGVLGGTFDPVHYGHLRPAQEIAEQLALDSVLLIPAARPPHRSPPLASFEHRYAMVSLAADEFPALIADDREAGRPGPSYSVDTLADLRRTLGDRPVCFLLGTDAFASLPEWHDWQQLPELAHLVVMQRPGCELSELPSWASDRLTEDPAELRARPAGLVIMLPVTPVNVSATGIRQALSGGQPVTGLLPPLVLEYIEAHGLYH